MGSFKSVLQANPLILKLDKLKEEILAAGDVEEVHQLRVWSLDGEQHVLTAHLVVNEQRSLEWPKVKIMVKERLQALGIQEVTLELEHPGEECGTKE